MDAFIQGILIGEKLIIGGDLIDYIGRNNNNYEQAHRGFPTSYGPVIANMCFIKRDEHITNENGLNSTPTDFFLLGGYTKSYVKTVK